MTDTPAIDEAPGSIDIGGFCRDVEEHLARVNGGHLIRIVGPGFELVRSWAVEGLPISIVYQGISQKAERHQRGRSKRPLRVEFCGTDVRSVYDTWLRAVGLHGSQAYTAATDQPAQEDSSAHSPKRPSLVKQLDRAVDRLARSAGRLDLPEAFRDTLNDVLQQVVTLRESARNARGPARDEIVSRLALIDRDLIDAARLAVGDEELGRMADEAARELRAYQARLAPDAWQRSIDLGTDRLIRERFGLPTLLL